MKVNTQSAAQAAYSTAMDKNRNDNSDTGKSRFQEALDRIALYEQTPELELVTGYELEVSLGLMALGGEKQLEIWKNKGLDMTEETVLEAAKVYQMAFKEHFERGMERHEGLLCNRYLIVMNSQQTPDWFRYEYQDFLSRLENPQERKELEEGALYTFL